MRTSAELPSPPLTFLPSPLSSSKGMNRIHFLFPWRSVKPPSVQGECFGRPPCSSCDSSSNYTFFSGRRNLHRAGYLYPSISCFPPFLRDTADAQLFFPGRDVQALPPERRQATSRGNGLPTSFPPGRRDSFGKQNFQVEGLCGASFGFLPPFTRPSNPSQSPLLTLSPPHKNLQPIPNPSPLPSRTTPDSFPLP